MKRTEGATLRTPHSEHKFVQALCERIVPGGKVIRVPVIPDNGARKQECFLNVQKRIEQHGGTVQHGWCIWELPGIFIEAEFHGVWVGAKGELIDVTPKPEREAEIMFLPDPAAFFDEASFNRRDNVRIAIMDHPVVHRFIKAAEDMTRLIEANTSPNDPQLVTVREDEHARYLSHKLALQAQVARLVPDPYSQCWCGSGKKLKWCCNA